MKKQKRKRYTFNLDDLTHRVLLEMKHESGLSMSKIMCRLVMDESHRDAIKKARKWLDKS